MKIFILIILKLFLTRHPNKHIKRKKCFLRSKEHNDYKENIINHIAERDMEEQNRNNMVFKHEMEKFYIWVMKIWNI